MSKGTHVWPNTDDPATKRVLFDLSYVPAPEEGEAVISALLLQMRRIGIDRFLFGSDYNVLTPAEAVSFIERLGLTEKQQEVLIKNCAPWVCPDAVQASRKTPRPRDS